MKMLQGRKAVVLGVVAGLALSIGLVVYSATASRPAPDVPDPTAGQQGLLLELNERVVNLQSGPYRYVKVGVTIEVRPESAGFYGLTGEARAAALSDALAAHESAVPLLLDALGTVVSAQNAKGLIAVDGRTRLKSELLDAFRDVLGEHEVLNVYLTDLVMQ